MTYLQESSRPAVTVPKLQAMREAGEKIAMLTSYDASFAALLDRANVDVQLIGDSLGNVLQGQATTLPVTLDDIAYHTACVARAQPRGLVVADLPFGTYGTPADAFASAVKLMRAGAQMVKLEGGEWLAETVRFLVERAVPVCAHVGLTPQSVHAFGGFKVQGKTEAGAAQLLRDARAVEEAGAQLIVLEAVPTLVAAEVTRELSIRRSASARAPNARARYSCCTTCSACSPASGRASSRISCRGSRASSRRSRPTCAR